MISEKDYKYIELTKEFPLTANDFKIGNATHEDVQKIKQHKKIEDAILTHFPNIDNIASSLNKSDIKLINEYKKCGFCLGEIALLCREVSLQTAMEAYIINNGGKLDEVSAKIIGLYYKEKDVYDTPEEVKKIIRLDGCGYFTNPQSERYSSKNNGKNKKLKPEYYNDINNHEKYKLIGGRIIKEKKRLRGPDGHRVIEEKERLVDSKKVLRDDLYIYPTEQYDLNISSTWKNVFSKFENFRNIEGKIVAEMQKYSLNPKTIEHMGINEFKDIISKAFYDDKNDANIISIFSGSVNQKVIHDFNIPENYEMLEKYLRFQKPNDKSMQMKMNLAKTRGLLVGDLSVHHIVHVSNAGEHLDYNLINHSTNLVIVSEFMHKLIHSSDCDYITKDKSKVFGLFPEKGKFDLMLSITPIFRTPYTGENIKQKEIKMLGGMVCQRM